MNRDHDEKQPLGARIAQFLQRKRFVFFIPFIIIALLIFYVVWTLVSEKIFQESTILAEQIHEKYSGLEMIYDEQEQKAAEEEVQSLMGEALQKYPGSYAAGKALIARASIYYKKVEESTAPDQTQVWFDIVSDFLEVVRFAPESYLADLSLYQAAVVLENLDLQVEKQGLKEITVEQMLEVIPDEFIQYFNFEIKRFTDIATALYLYFAEQYKDSPRLPHVLLSAARLYQAKSEELTSWGNSDKAEEAINLAMEIYYQLEIDFPYSNWTNIARISIIELKIKNIIK